MDKHVFTVNNMTCNGCVASIQQGLEADARIKSINIKLSKQLVTVEGDLTSEEAAEVIRNAGYQPEVGASKKGFLGNLFSS
ncbi:MAG: heavy metal-associated domain-containing protein [Candidatus Marinimicrobia bacterium]|nr:heavy metal-associated domain-containing protein [Candidatus Neomarinimicrobiota bacterium]